MGRQPKDKLGRHRLGRDVPRVDVLLARLGVEINVQNPIRALSVADQQLVEIAKALSINARVLVMDEPTASLSSREVDAAVHDRAAVAGAGRGDPVRQPPPGRDLRDFRRDHDLPRRRYVITAPAAKMTTEAVIRHMVGRRLESLFPKEARRIGDVVLEVRQLTRSAIFAMSASTLRRGEILGSSGWSEPGEREVARVVFGHRSGEIRRNPRSTADRSTSTRPCAAMRQGIGYVPGGSA